jgi:adenosine deaminase
MVIEHYLHDAPKTELHVHLEGSIQPTTLLELAKRNNIPLPIENEAQLRQLFYYRDFDHFIELFRLGAYCLQTSEDFEQITYELGEEMARQNVRYAEVTVTPATHYRRGILFDVFFSGMQRGRARVLADFDIEMNWIFNIVRQWIDPTMTLPMAEYVTSVAIEGKLDGVLALGLAGCEAGAPPEPFAPWFKRARAAGLHSIPHAGEMAGPESVWGAIYALGAERIAHGVRAIEDVALVEYLAQHHIPLDVTPTSNICLGVYPSYAAHPLAKLYAAGIPINISTDDPPFFHITLDEEILHLVNDFHIVIEDVDKILLNGFHASLLPEQRRREMEQEVLTELTMLKKKYLTDNGE